MARVYATSSDYQTYSGQPSDADTDRLLARASQFLDAKAFRLCRYVADPVTGMPIADPVIAAFRDATCAQVQWWAALGDPVGAIGAGWSTIRIGTAHMQRSDSAVRGADSAAREVAPQVWDVLQSPDLITHPPIFALGMVLSW